jgi:Reverse transcriptase (RNA-dependent DNA polymerase)
VLSPLLANIYLQPLDDELAGRGVAFVRYADDIALFAGSERAAKRLLASGVEWIERQKYFWQRRHHPRGRANALRRLGVRGRGIGVAWSRRGAWPMARHVVVQQALKTARLNRAGFGLPWELASKP